MGLKITRRQFLYYLAALGAGSVIDTSLFAAKPGSLITRAIPSTGEVLPAIGMGSWLTFAVDDERARQQRLEVLRSFFDMGGALIDSSPMYGSSEEVIGYCLARLDNAQQLFAATKVWTSGWRAGVRQMEKSRLLWGIQAFDLMQIHNLLDWETHIETLKAWKAEGRIRYLGITTSHGRRHDDMRRIMRSQPLDFVQFTYNVADREAEQYLLPLAQERGVAVIINRPFQRGGLFDRVANKPLPDWAAEIDCHNWAQFFLKFIISHPAVTCAIPATSRVDHMRENMGACYGRLPDAQQRVKMSAYVRNL